MGILIGKNKDFNAISLKCDRNTPPSRDMLVAKRNLLQSELATLNATVRITAEKQDKAKRTTDALQQKSDIRSQRRDNATRDAVDAQIKCMNKRSTNRDQTSEGQDPCDEYEEEADHAVDATYEQAEASSEYFSANLLLRSEQRFQKFMQSKMSALEQQISELENQLAKLKGSQVYLGAIAESPEFESLNKGSGEAEDKWLKFDYNSDSTHTNTAGNSNSVSVTTGISVPLLVTVNSHYNKDEEEMREAFNSANLQASGELLRVFIKRPWFKPSLFDNPVFNFVSSNFASL